MAKSKLDTFLAFFPLLALTAAFASANADTASASALVVLKEGETARVSCPTGSAPQLKGDELSCNGDCELSVVSTTYELDDQSPEAKRWGTHYNCEIGGCTVTVPVVLFTLKDSTGAVLHRSHSYDTRQQETAIQKIQQDFSGACKTVRVSRGK